MDANPIGALFRRYKCGTNHVIQWLANAALDQTDALVPSLQDLSLPKHHHDAQNLTRNRQIIRRLSTQDLVQLAEALSKTATASRPPPPGLDDAVSVLEDVISGRRECAQWYSIKASKRSDSDKSHQHFVDVLLRVLQCLKTIVDKSKDYVKARTSKKKKNARKIKDSLSKENLHNIYHALFVEEFETVTAVEEESAVKPQKKLPTRKVVFQLEKSREDEAEFALWCFLKECLEIRRFVQTTWVDHQANETSLILPFRITENALCLILDAADEFQREFPELDNFDKIADLLEIRAVSSGRHLQEFTCKDDRIFSESDKTSAQQLVCIEALTGMNLLRQFCIAMRSNTQMGVNTLGTSSHFASLLEGSDYFWRGLLDSIPELVDLGWDPDRLTALFEGDSFTRIAMQSTLNFEFLSLSSVLAHQVHFEISQILGPEPVIEYGMRRAYAEMLRPILSNFPTEVGKYSRVQHLGGNLVESTHRSRILKSISVLKTPPRDLLVALTSHYNEDDDGYSSLQGHFPTLNGHLMFSMSSLQHMDGIECCNHDTVLISMVHLYRACRASGHLKTKWSDLEFIIEQQGKKAFGLFDDPGASTRSMRQAAKIFGMALGVELKDYTKGRGRDHQKTSWTRVPLPPLTTILKRMSKVKTSSHFNRVLAERIKTNSSLKYSQKYVLREAIYYTAQEYISGGDEGIDAETRSQWNACRKLTPVQALGILKTSYIKEELHTLFSYHELLIKCYHIFSVLNQKLAETTRDENRLAHELVDDILWVSAAMEGTKYDGPIEFAARALTVAINGMGSECLNAARPFCSGSMRDEVREFKLGRQAAYQNAKIARGNKGKGGKVTLMGSKIDLPASAPLTPEQLRRRELLLAKRKELFDFQATNPTLEEFREFDEKLFREVVEESEKAGENDTREQESKTSVEANGAN